MSKEADLQLQETRRRLDEHRQLGLGKRVVRRLTGEYPEYSDRSALRRHELAERPPHEKIRDIVQNANHYILQSNASLFRIIFRATIKTGSNVDKRIIATEALTPSDPASYKLAADLCNAGGRSNILQDPELTRHGYYIPRKKSERRDVAVGLYFANEDMSRIEKVPFSEDEFTALPDALQQGAEKDAASLAEHSHHVPPYESGL